jgi:hypothetical protein
MLFVLSIIRLPGSHLGAEHWEIRQSGLQDGTKERQRMRSWLHTMDKAQKRKCDSTVDGTARTKLVLEQPVLLRPSHVRMGLNDVLGLCTLLFFQTP